LSLNEKAKEDFRMKTWKIWNKIFGFHIGDRVIIEEYPAGLDGEIGWIASISFRYREFGGIIKVVLDKGGWVYCREEELRHFEET